MASIVLLLFFAFFVALIVFGVMTVLDFKSKKKGKWKRNIKFLAISLVGLIGLGFLFTYFTTKEAEEDKKELLAERAEWKKQAPDVIHFPEATQEYVKNVELDFLYEASKYPDMNYDVLVEVTKEFEALTNSEKYILIEEADNIIRHLEFSGCKNDGDYDEYACDYNNVHFMFKDQNYTIKDSQLYNSSALLSMVDEPNTTSSEQVAIDPDMLLSDAFAEYHKGFYLQIELSYMHLEALKETIDDGYFSQYTIDDNTEYIAESNETLASYAPPAVQTSKDQELLDKTKELIQFQKEGNDRILAMLNSGYPSSDTVDSVILSRDLYYEGKAMGF